MPEKEKKGIKVLTFRLFFSFKDLCPPLRLAFLWASLGEGYHYSGIADRQRLCILWVTQSHEEDDRRNSDTQPAVSIVSSARIFYMTKF